MGAPRLVRPSWNCTVPVGVPGPAVTVAVKLTDWPATDGFGPAERTRAVVVGETPTFTVWLTPGDVEVVKLVSPAYVATSVLAPVVVEVSVHCPAPTAALQVS